MKYHTYIKFKSLFNDSECRTVSQSKRKRGSVGSSFSVCVSIYCIYRRVTQTFVRSQNEFSEHLSPRTAKLHTGHWDTSACPWPPLEGRLASLAEHLPPRAGKNRETVNTPAATRVCFQMEKYTWACPDSRLVFPSLVTRSFGSPFLLFPVSSFPFSFGLQQMSLLFRPPPPPGRGLTHKNKPRGGNTNKHRTI